ncbi:MAG: hypothetical protein WA843_00670, partial [Candidatus Saccharimonadales bacterium]
GDKPKKAEAFSLWPSKDKTKSNDTSPTEFKSSLSTEAKELSEAEIDRVARITGEEKAFVIPRIAQEMSEQSAETSETDAPGVDGSQIFLERVASGEDPDAVSAEMLTALGTEPKPFHVSGPAESHQPVDESSVLASEATPDVPLFANEAEQATPFGEMPHDIASDIDAGREGDSTTSGTRSTTSAGGAGGAGGSGRSTPPPAGGGGPPFGSTPPPGGPAFGPPLEYNPNLAAANQPVQRVEYVDRSNEVGMFLLGGIIGYLIGRRRGRIKTEKKLLPVQKKLEKQVKHLHDQLEEKRLQIHDAAVKKARAEHWSRAELRQKLQPRRPQAEHPRVEQRTAAPEARQLHGKKPASEQIGHVLLTAEAAHRQVAEGRTPNQVQPNQFETDKNIDTLSRAELLAMSEKIVVEGSSLRQVYETHLIGERGLRRLVREHLRGGDVQKALRREVVEREIDFERDPAARDHVSHDGGTKSDATTALRDLLRRANNDSDTDKEQTAILESRATYEADRQAQQQRHRRMTDISIAVVVAILVSLIITLYLTRL